MTDRMPPSRAPDSAPMGSRVLCLPVLGAGAAGKPVLAGDWAGTGGTIIPERGLSKAPEDTGVGDISTWDTTASRAAGA